MDKILLKRFVKIFLLITVLSSIIIFLFLYHNTCKQVYGNMEEVLTQEEGFYNNWSLQADERLTDYAGEYLNRLYGIDYLLAEHNSFVSQNGLQMLASMFNVEEIYLFSDNKIVLSNQPDAVGKSLNGDEESQAFSELMKPGSDMVLNLNSKPIIGDTDTFNYLAVHPTAPDYSLLLIAINKSDVQEIEGITALSTFLDEIPMAKGNTLLAIDNETGELISSSGSPDSSIKKMLLKEYDKKYAEKLRKYTSGQLIHSKDFFVFVKSKVVEDVLFVDFVNAAPYFRDHALYLFCIIALMGIVSFTTTRVIRNFFKEYIFNDLKTIQQTLQTKMQSDSHNISFASNNETELGEIVNALNEWNMDVKKLNEKMNWTIHSIGSKVAIFETRHFLNSIFYSDNMQKILGTDDETWNRIKDDLASFKNYIRQLQRETAENGCIFFNDKYLKIELHPLSNRDIFGLIMDETKEVLKDNALSKAITDSNTDPLRDFQTAAALKQIPVNFWKTVPLRMPLLLWTWTTSNPLTTVTGILSAIRF